MELRDRKYAFEDRLDAGKVLGSMLQTGYGSIEGGVVMAIPSGGVPVGIKVSERLDLPFDLVIVRKLQIPGNPEAGFGAMTLDGKTFLNDVLSSRLTSQQIDMEKARVRSELEKRNAKFRRGRPLPDLTNKKVILVDDGLASGYTMLASIDMVRQAKAAETIVAVPTAPLRSIDLITPKADKIFCANIRTSMYFAVADAYRNWYDLTEEEVLDLLRALKPISPLEMDRAK